MYKVIRRFSKPADSEWMYMANPDLTQRVNNAINSLSDFPGFIARNVESDSTSLRISTLCESEAAYEAYSTAKNAALLSLKAEHDAFIVAQNIVELPETREQI